MGLSADENLTQEFVAEAKEHLDSIEPDLLALERSREDVAPEVINHLFRAIHSIKGSAGFLGIECIIQLGHVMENVLMQMRDEKLFPNPENIDALLAGVDKMSLMVENIDVCDSIDSNDVLARLDEVASGKPSPSPSINRAIDPPQPGTSPYEYYQAAPFTETTPDAPVPTTAEHLGSVVELVIPGPDGFEETIFQIEIREIETALQGELAIQALWIRTEDDLLNLGRSQDDFLELAHSLGDVLASDFSNQDAPGSVVSPQEPGVLHLLLASIVEEPELGAGILEVPSGQMVLIPPQWIRAKPDSGNGRNDPPLDSAPSGVPLVLPRLPLADRDDEVSKPEMAPTRVPNTGQEFKVNPEAMAGRLTSETIRINVQLIDRMMNLAGELVLGRNQLQRLLEQELDRNPGLGGVIQNLNLVTTDIQEQIMKLRMQPMGSLFGKLPRLVRDLSRNLGKEAELFLKGADVELDRSILEALSDPLIHLIRNALDHGIEAPAVRSSRGKRVQGRILVTALHEEGQVHVTVTDDGQGIDPDRVAAKAVAGGLVSRHSVEKMNGNEKMDLVFLPALSLARTVTDLSGRGVGMDVVRTNIENIGGRIELESAPDRGTTVRLRLPLTLAIIPSLIIRAGGQSFAIPQMDVQELVCIQAADTINRIEKIGQADVLRLRGRLLPLVRLSDALDLEPRFIHPVSGKKMIDRRVRIADRRSEKNTSSPENPQDEDEEAQNRRANDNDRRKHRSGDIFIVVLRVGPNRFGLLVNELINTEEIVVKPLPTHLKECRQYSGTTILGDGRVAMILNAGGLAGSAALRFGEVSAEERRRQEEARKEKDRKKPVKSVILFTYAPNEFFAIPLAKVSRLEKLNREGITRIGEREFMTYRGAGLPLIRLDKYLPVTPLPETLDSFLVIVPKAGRLHAGILASGVVDTVDTEADIISEQKEIQGLEGSAIIEERLTLWLNPEELLERSTRDLTPATSAAGPGRDDS